MKFNETELKGAFVLEINQLTDERGFFGRSWCKREMEEHGLNGNVVQANTSFSKTKGTLRGMHYQKHPHEETKLIRCTKGAIYDVIVDLRKDSPTYLKWFGIELSENNYKMLYVPEKFAHGFISLTDDAEVTYLVTEYYTPGAEAGLRFNDPKLKIDWPLDVTVISEKDRQHPDFDESVLP
ncbi:dTDP-4-dehydrorhamnose 3,5-epimerase [Sunxiuqinia dokdonensis]|uniref:dTDP-4-dehydrorhamnose 3,5-epimerase n=1 Tax=Sunxiuqinia dokdonensis TaxID=1409788 RepID=A0A0L8VEN8_9BACT|nr:dTDP-4-dehydrorhamnose 3,5-epimerase [Sunxiuqinia dokdonensis]KOH46940.1 dTDP-4-dehydrorhamnose 3,5-epimerase [Sunxiuqinia dokdonensis]